MVPTPPTIDEIIAQLAFDDYITRPKELETIRERCKAVLRAQTEKVYDQKAQVEETLRFIEALWSKYDCRDVARVYTEFVKIEEALYGLEREEEKGERYRDHFVHMFNCFLFGLRLISLLTASLSDEKSKAKFKVEDENLKARGLPFGVNYTFKQRLFYIWTLISTFHDIAIPFQHLTKIGSGVNKFIKEFGWVFTDASISMRHFDASQLYRYFGLLASIYGKRLSRSDGGQVYERAEPPPAYLLKLLGREFDQRNHSVLSGFFVWKTVEEIFLVGRSEKYQLTADQFDIYSKLVLEQDVARAALAISLHGLKEDEKTNVYPKVFPIRFSDFPLTFLLILSDETQEYLRWEGTGIRREIKFEGHPPLDVVAQDNSISVRASFSFHPDQEDYIVGEVRKLMKRRDPNRKILDTKSAAVAIGESVAATLRKKLRFGDDFRFAFSVYRDWKDLLYSVELAEA